MDGHAHNELERSQAELLLLYEIGNAMRTTLKLDEILFIILTGLTAHDGLGFNRAVLFLVNEHDRTLEGKMGIGPDSGEDAQKIWTTIEHHKWGLEDLVSAYDHWQRHTHSKLNALVSSIRIPIAAASGILAQTALQRTSIGLTEQEARKLSDPVFTQLDVGACVTVPLMAKDRVVGIVLADNRYTGKPIVQDDVRLLNLLANHAGLAIENSKLYEALLMVSYQDSLTKAWNHGYFQDLLTDELRDTSGSGESLALIMADIDDFKRYNDTHGHQAGDRLLKELADILKENVRAGDLVCRYGGEEFAIILPKTDRTLALEIAERLRRVVGETVTVSIGLAVFPADAQEKGDLIHKADLALYQAKRTGKNRTCFYPASRPSAAAG